ncbi:coiled-coil domain-containing protein [[Clostridium] colinum]|uniref:coiled-coil domain-containing protein n=1 Tax=[Clostridium] colinum TaxID=36835 RepID=UPI0020256BBF|nr:hypothetical protein [[Clostridium] colinum]
MQNNYILNNKNNEILSFYYGEERAIYCKKLGSNNYPIVSKIIQDVTDCFTVDIGPNKEIYIFCQNYNGEIVLCKLEQDTFKHKVLFKNKSEGAENILFYPIFFKGNMSLIYNTPNNMDNNFLAIKTLVGGKGWTRAENIDAFSVIPNNIFYVQKVNQDNIVVAYQKKSKDIQIGYKEIKNGNISDFITVHKTGYQIVDYSFIAFKDVVHYVYVIKSLFSSQVIYKRKDENGLSNPIILFEGQKIKSCNISVLNDNLYCSFIAGSTLYYCQSEDFGRSFLGISKYRKQISQDIIKARFLSTVNMTNSSVNEVYIDAKNTLNIYMLPELLPNLFNKKQDIKQNRYSFENNNQDKFITNLNSQFIDNIDIEKPETNVNNTYKNLNKPQNTMFLENDFMANFNLEEFSKISNLKEHNKQLDFNNTINTSNNISNMENIDNNLILENKVKMLNEQLSEKNSQILKLNSIIQNKNNEKTDIEIHLRQKIKNMENENNSLLEKINILQQEIENIKNITKQIEREDIDNNEKDISKSQAKPEENEEK